MSEKEEKPIQKADEYAYNYWAMMAPTQKELKAWHEAGGRACAELAASGEKLPRVRH